MGIDYLKNLLNEKYASVSVPTNLKKKVLSGIYEQLSKEKTSFKRKVAIACLGAFLTLPPLSYAFFADQIYGSQQKAASYGIPQTEYNSFNNKLSQAASILKPHEFVEFIGLAKDLIFFMLKYGDTSTKDRNKFGQVDVSKLSPDKQKEYNELVKKIQPYFDKLNAATVDQPTRMPIQPVTPEYMYSYPPYKK